MMPRFEIVEARSFHCGQIIRALRREHAAALGGDTRQAHRNLRACFDDSSFRRAWMIDSRLAGLGGVTGSFASGRGFIWLALTQEATRYPLEIVREARRQLDEILGIKQEVTTTVVFGDETARRFAAFLGFRAATSSPIVHGDVKADLMRLRRFEEA